MRKATLSDIKEVFGNIGKLQIENVYKKSGTVRAYVFNKETDYKTSGSGYDKDAHIIEKIVNDVLDTKENRFYFDEPGKFEKHGISIEKTYLHDSNLFTIKKI